jgi:hypothetical protein
LSFPVVASRPARCVALPMPCTAPRATVDPIADVSGIGANPIVEP